MENKTLTLMVLSILSVVAVLGIMSAAVDFYPTSLSGTVNNGSSLSFSLKAYNDYTSNLTDVNLTVSNLTSGSNVISSSALVLTGAPSLIENKTNSSTITLTVSVPSTAVSGVYTGNIEIYGNYTTRDKRGTLPITLNVTNPANTKPVTCQYNNTHDNLRVKKISFTNNGFSGKSFGQDDEWFPIDEVEAEMTIENRGNEKIEDIELNWGLYDSSSKGWVIDLTDEDKFSLSHDKSKTITVKFSLDDADMDLEDLRDGEYTFYVQASGYDSEYSEDVCVLDSETVSIIIETDFVVLNKLSVPETLSCGSDFSVSANVWNVGEDDQEGVYVLVYNKDLKINKKIDIGDVNAFSYENLESTLTLPLGLKDGIYPLNLLVYNENDEIYKNDYSDDESKFVAPLKITCTGEETPSTQEPTKVVVSASLESGGKAGEDMVIKSAITNLESTPVTYSVSISGYSNWATSAQSDQNTFTLASGESKAVSFTFKVKDASEGENFFDIELMSGGKLISKQPVSVSIEKKGFSLSQLGGNNNYIWAIAALNVLLVIVIIVVAVRVMRR